MAGEGEKRKRVDDEEDAAEPGEEEALEGQPLEGAPAGDEDDIEILDSEEDDEDAEDADEDEDEDEDEDLDDINGEDVESESEDPVPGRVKVGRHIFAVLHGQELKVLAPLWALPKSSCTDKMVKMILSSFETIVLPVPRCVGLRRRRGADIFHSMVGSASTPWARLPTGSLLWCTQARNVEIFA